MNLRHSLILSRVERGTRPHVGGGLDIQHLVVFPELRAAALDTDVESEGGDSGNGTDDRECGEGFVETADHHTGFVVPVDDHAAVAEGAAEVPGQEDEAEEPDDR